MKKPFLASFTVLLLAWLLFPVNSGELRVCRAALPSTIHVPDEYGTIQEAINAAAPGDTVFVSEGLYYERVVVNKSLALVGEDRETTVVDGQNSGTIIQITADNVRITGLKLQHTGWKWGWSGIKVTNANNCEIEGNFLFHTCHQIRLESSRESEIIGNIISAPNGSFPHSAYGIRLENCTRCVIMNNTISNNIGGVHLENATDCAVLGNYIFQNGQGVRLYSPCLFNRIAANTIYNNTYDGMIEAMRLNQTLRGNIFAHNNFVNNSKPFIYKVTGCVWDDGKEGNYWTRYNGSDVDHDGIGDTPYNVGQERDEHPLMGVYRSYNVSRGASYVVGLVCKASVTGFSFDTADHGTKNVITFNLSDDGKEPHFCRISIPRGLLNGPYTVAVDGSEESNTTLKELPPSNNTQAFLYFTYNSTNSLHTVMISGGQDIQPPLAIYAVVLAALLAVSSVAAILLIRRGRKKIEEETVTS